MVVPFNKQQQIHSRYKMLSPQPVVRQLGINGENMSRYDGQEYATFIRTLNTSSIKPQDKLLTRPKVKSSTVKSISPNPSSMNMSMKPTAKTSQAVLSKSAPANIHHTLQNITQIKVKSDENHKKKMTVIEDYMFQCKQDERELKRIEGDIIKKERNVKKVMRDYETDVYSEKRQEEKLATTADQENEIIKQKHYIDDEKLTKEKINRNINLVQKEKETESKAANTLNNLEFHYENIAEAISLKRMEVNELMKEFEKKVRQKEEEEFRLKKEFANLSLELNMVAQKQRVQTVADKRSLQAVDHKDKTEQLKREENLNEKLRFQKERGNHAEVAKRRLSKDLHNVISTLSIQEREDGRRLMDVKYQLHDNALNQKEAQIKAELLDMERQGVLSEEKIMTVDTRRKAIQDLITQQRKQKNDLSMDEWRRRSFVVNHEVKKENLKDNINHFQKVVAKQEEVEHQLYNQVRQLESDRRKQEQNVTRLREELTETQKQNKILLRETALRCHEQEVQLQQRLLKEEAQLGKALSEREERIQTLVRCRGASKEDKHMLEEERKVHDRLVRIEKKSNLLRNQHQFQEIY